MAKGKKLELLEDLLNEGIIELAQFNTYKAFIEKNSSMRINTFKKKLTEEGVNVAKLDEIKEAKAEVSTEAVVEEPVVEEVSDVTTEVSDVTTEAASAEVVIEEPVVEEEIVEEPVVEEPVIEEVVVEEPVAEEVVVEEGIFDEDDKTALISARSEYVLKVATSLGLNTEDATIKEWLGKAVDTSNETSLEDFKKEVNVAYHIYEDEDGKILSSKPAELASERVAYLTTVEGVRPLGDETYANLLKIAEDIDNEISLEDFKKEVNAAYGVEENEAGEIVIVGATTINPKQEALDQAASMLVYVAERDESKPVIRFTETTLNTLKEYVSAEDVSVDEFNKSLNLADVEIVKNEGTEDETIEKTTFEAVKAIYVSITVPVKAETAEKKKGNLLTKIIDKVTYVATWPIAQPVGALIKKIKIKKEKEKVSLASTGFFKPFSETYADNKKLAKGLQRSIAGLVELGLAGLMVVACANAPAVVQQQEEVITAEEVAAMKAQIAKLYEAVYAESGLLNTIDNTVYESDYDWFLKVVDINGINIVTNADGKTFMQLSILATNDKTGEGERKHYTASYELTAEEVAAYNNSSINISSLFSAIVTDNAAEQQDKIGYYQLVDLDALTAFVNGLTSFAEGKEPVIEFNKKIETNFDGVETESSPLVDMYNTIVATEEENIKNSTDLSEEEKTAALAELNNKKLPISNFTTVGSITNAEINHYFTYEMTETGFNVNVTAVSKVANPFTVKVKVADPDGRIFSEEELIQIVKAYIVEGVKPANIDITLADTTNPISSFELITREETYVWDYVEKIANTSDEKIDELAQEHNDALKSPAEEENSEEVTEENTNKTEESTSPEENSSTNEEAAEESNTASAE